MHTCSSAGIPPHFLMSDWGELILPLAERSNAEDGLMRLAGAALLVSTISLREIYRTMNKDWERETGGEGHRDGVRWKTPTNVDNVIEKDVAREREGNRAIAIKKFFCCGSVWRLGLPVVENVNGTAAPLQGFSTQPLRELSDRRANKQTHPQKSHSNYNQGSSS